MTTCSNVSKPISEQQSLQVLQTN